jgi:acetyl-CoA acetyltransferase
MPCTADFPHQIAHTHSPQSAHVLDDAAALHAAVDGLDVDPAPRDPSIGRFLSALEGSASGLLGGHDALDVVERERQEAESLEQLAARGHGIGCSVCHPLVVGAPPRGVAQS